MEDDPLIGLLLLQLFFILLNAAAAALGLFHIFE